MILHVPEHVSLHAPLQLPVHPLLHALSAHPHPQSLTHVPEQFSIHAELHPKTSVLDAAIAGALAKIKAPTMGNAFFAASLKNSLRDWRSSFSFVDFIL